MKIPIAAMLALCLAAPAVAQEPVTGVADPEALFEDDDPALHRNEQATLHIMRELLQCNQWDRAGEWIADRYIQHNPLAASGLDGVVTFFTEVLGVERTDDCGPLTTEIVAVVAEDDYVTVLTPARAAGPAGPRQHLHDDLVRHLALRRW